MKPRLGTVLMVAFLAVLLQAAPAAAALPGKNGKVRERDGGGANAYGKCVSSN